MKKILLFITIGLIVFASCQKKAIPVITERKEETVRGTTRSIDLSETIAPDTVAGRSIFVGRCGRCHGLPDPSIYTQQRWEGILTSMIPKAKLDDVQKVHITAYVKANAAK